MKSAQLLLAAEPNSQDAVGCTSGYPSDDLFKEMLMRLALLESKKALPECRPNPPVGCVVWSAGAVVSSGFTQPPGRHHAEAMALSKVGQEVADLVVFVTLEPCSFDGRTPSCAQALVARRVSTVIIGLHDPHPRNQGAGIQVLQEAGIQVECGVLSSEIEDFLNPYLLR